ncbi:MAG TPA: ATP synthase F1 subunit gamma [Candidatus Saccharimonadales bacterium]|nr:ATP synthase F1 subunit gamma [Candidatus Saccharimonadales bacterium]
MASTIILKRRIKSIRGTRQITKAMQLVSASKLRRAQEYALRSRDYRNLAYDLLRKLNAMDEVERTSFFAKRTVKNRLYVMITSNTGLAGAYNANVLKLLAQDLVEDESKRIKSHVIVIGSKGANFVRRLANVDLMAAYPPFGDQPTANDVRPILNTVLQQFKEEKVDDVRVLYTEFKSTVSQQVQDMHLLPAPVLEQETSGPLFSNFEPDVETVVEQATTRLVEAQIWQALLEGLASEHAMRMIATKNATENANDLIGDYTLELNTARQAAITQELAEITGGAEALNG